MLKLKQRQILDMLQTLREAADALFSQNGGTADLISDISDFVSAIAGHIINALGDEPEEVLSLLQLNDLLKNEPLDAAVITRHITDASCAIKRLIISINLKAETDFSNYIDLLADAAEEGYCILITSMDTPCGSPAFTREMGERLCRTGIRTNLSNKWRASYCAVTDGGVLIAEEISDTHSVVVNCELGGCDIQIKSAGFGKLDAPRGCSITINGKQTAVGNIGLFFTVFDKDTNEILDSVSFDTYTADIECKRAGDSEFIKEFKRNNPGVTFISPRYPRFPSDKLSDNERWILENGIHHSIIKENPSLPSVIRNYIKEPAGIVEVLTLPLSYIGTDGSRYFEDYTGKYLNTRNGRRVTSAQPKAPNRTIFIMGDCNALGIGVRDEGTYASRLQKLLNENAGEHGFIVENYSFGFTGIASNKQREAILSALPVKPGDIIIGHWGGISAYNPALDERPYKHGELFFDNAHFTETAHRLIADGLFDALKRNNFFEDTLNKEPLKPRGTARDYGLSPEQHVQLEEYKRMLSDIVKNEAGASASVGAIVMNCNPFTNGHRYLIEECSKKVGLLIIFVVQEDKSIFPFADRIELVRRGVHDLSNVRVVESGKFIISTLTFKEYFNKSQLQNKIIDSSNDVTLFANEIAPAANIKIRFAGSEPVDMVTNQYNMTLARILPRYGIQFEEIPRKKKGGGVISASKVRKLLKSKDWNAIRELVPDVTYDYLKNNNPF